MTPGQGVEIPTCLRAKNKQTKIKRKQKEYCNKFNKDFLEKEILVLSLDYT